MYWLLYFDDPDHENAIFSSEAAARDAFKIAKEQWSCSLLVDVSRVDKLRADLAAAQADLEKSKNNFMCAATDVVYWKEKYLGRWASVGDDQEKAELRTIIREKDADLAAANARLNSIENAEGATCPEDVSFPEWIKILTKRLAADLVSAESLQEIVEDRDVKIVALQAELEAARADNAIWSDLYGELRRSLFPFVPTNANYDDRFRVAYDKLCAMSTMDHPGSALLEEMRRMREALAELSVMPIAPITRDMHDYADAAFGCIERRVGIARAALEPKPKP